MTIASKICSRTRQPRSADNHPGMDKSLVVRDAKEPVESDERNCSLAVTAENQLSVTSHHCDSPCPVGDQNVAWESALHQHGEGGRCPVSTQGVNVTEFNRLGNGTEDNRHDPEAPSCALDNTEEGHCLSSLTRNRLQKLQFSHPLNDNEMNIRKTSCEDNNAAMQDRPYRDSGEDTVCIRVVPNNTELCRQKLSHPAAPAEPMILKTRLSGDTGIVASGDSTQTARLALQSAGGGWEERMVPQSFMSPQQEPQGNLGAIYRYGTLAGQGQVGQQGLVEQNPMQGALQGLPSRWPGQGYSQPGGFPQGMFQPVSCPKFGPLSEQSTGPQWFDYGNLPPTAMNYPRSGAGGSGCAARVEPPDPAISYAEFADYPGKILSPSARLFISVHMDQSAQTLSKAGYKKNYEGLGECMQYNVQHLLSLSERQNSPTESLLLDWQRKSDSTLGDLVQHFILLDRYDILNDPMFREHLQRSVDQDKREKKREEAVKDKKGRPERRPLNLAAVNAVGGEQNFDAFVCFDPKDYAVIHDEMLPILEKELGLRLYIPDRDMSTSENELSATEDAVRNKCPKTVVVLSKAFCEANDSVPWYAMQTAQRLDPAVSTGRLVVAQIEPCSVPQTLSNIFIPRPSAGDSRTTMWQRVAQALRSDKELMKQQVEKAWRETTSRETTLRETTSSDKMAASKPPPSESPTSSAIFSQREKNIRANKRSFFLKKKR